MHNILIKSEKNITPITGDLRAKVHHTHYGVHSLSSFQIFYNYFQGEGVVRMLASWYSVLTTTDTHFLFYLLGRCYTFSTCSEDLKFKHSPQVAHMRKEGAGKEFPGGGGGKPYNAILNWGTGHWQGRRRQGGEKRNLDIIMHGPQYSKILNSELLHYEGKHQDRKQHGPVSPTRLPSSG